MEQLFETVQPDGDLSNIGSYLEDETRKLVIRLGNGEDVKKTNYLVITDGIPSELRISHNIEQSSPRCDGKVTGLGNPL